MPIIVFRSTSEEITLFLRPSIVESFGHVDPRAKPAPIRSAYLPANRFRSRCRSITLAVTFGWITKANGSTTASVHVDIVDESLWIRCDNTDWVIAQELAGAGVPKDRNRTRFWPPEKSKRNTDFRPAS